MRELTLRAQLSRLLNAGLRVSAFASLLSLYVPSVSAEQPREIKASLSSEGTGSLRKVAFAPMSLRGGSTLTLISPQAWAPLAEKIRAVLESTHDNYANLLGEVPAFTTAVRLMDEDTFFAATGAPRWTNAMYYKSQIIIPLAANTQIDMDGLTRAIKHEYTHAIIHALSGGRCPGWLDEGLAQWAEGSENPALRPALKIWVRERGAVPLALLQGGFTRLEQKMVPAAYAQSLYAAYVVLDSFGFSTLRNFFDGLRDGRTKSEAFERSFGVSEISFETQLQASLKKWSAS